jgi:hypothetical protein
VLIGNVMTIGPVVDAPLQAPAARRVASERRVHRSPNCGIRGRGLIR